MPEKANRGHRPHSEVKRTVQKRAWFTLEESLLVEQASTRRGLKPGAFVAATAVEAAKVINHNGGGAAAPSNHPAAIHELREFAAEVRELRRLLGNVAGNLNDVARHANSTGELGENADAVLAYTRRMNTQIDSWLMQVLRIVR